MKDKEEETFEKIATSIERHGLGIASFIVLICFLGNQIYTSNKFTEKFFELESIKIKQTEQTNERLTKLEKLIEKAFERK